MASTIRIKRSSVAGNPNTLAAGELAYSALTDNGSNGGDRLYIGIGAETSGNAANHYVIGGKYFTDLMSGTAGTLTTNAKSVPILSATGTIDKWYVGNLYLTGNTLVSTDTNGNINITPNGTGKTVLSNVYIGDTSTTLQEYIYDQVGGTITAGTGIVSTVSDAGNTTTLSLATSGVTAGTYGSASAIPSLTVDTYGRITSISTNSISSSLTIGTTTISLGGTSTTLAGMTSIAFAGSTSGSTTVQASATAGTSTLTLPAATDTLVGRATTDTLTNKTISGASNTLTNIGNSSLTNSSVTINGTSVSLGGSATVTAAAGTLTGTTLNSTVVTSSLTSVGTISSGTWNGTTIAVAYGGTGTATGSITGTGALTFTAGGSNTNVNLVPQGTGTVDVANARITSVGTPTQTTDAATKGYVDSVKQALDIKDSVRVATTANLTATASGTGAGKTLTNAGTQAAITIDSIVLVSGDRVLVKDQTTGANNGIYTVTTVGTASTNWVLTRATDADNSPSGEVTAGMFTFVEEGTVNADSGWVLTTDNAITLDTTTLTFVQFSGAGQVIAGNGLTKSGNTLDVVGTTNRISVAADSIDISTSYVGQTSITTLGTIGTGTWNGSVISPVYGGTGVANGSSNTITFTGNYTLGLTLSAATSVTLPTTGTLATLAGSEALSNKTITSSSFSGTTLSASGNVTFTSTTDATALGTAPVVLSGGLSIDKSVYVGTNITGAGASTSTLDGFTIDGGTY